VKKFLVINFIFLFASFSLFGGITCKISGNINDATTGEPLPAANVVIEGTDMGAASDMDGDYFIINITPGTYTVVVSMMGYETIRKTDVIVSTDRTTTVDFSLRPSTLLGEEVTVVAEREIVPMDVSASHIVAGAEQIIEVPLVTNILEYINIQAGVEDMRVRGGGLDQTKFMMDGLTVVDNRSNSPMMMVNISSVKELNIIKGGFNAEYGNVRSGVVNVVTKEGSPSEYHGSIDFRISPPHLKHFGYSMFDHNNFYLRPYLDEDVCWEGTKSGAWDEETQDQYQEFMGWNAYSKILSEDDDPTNDKTPAECRDLFIWRHMAEGAAELIPKGYKGNYHEGHEGDKPDWYVDFGFGGPVPVLSKYLGKLSFFTSYKTNWETWGLPLFPTDYYKEDNFQLRLTSHISPTMKLGIEGIYGEINSASTFGGGGDSYYRSGNDVFWRGEGYAANSVGEERMYYPGDYTPFDVYQNMLGLSFDHALSPSTFYSARISYIRIKNQCSNWERLRDTTTIRYFGNTPVDEVPFGFWYEGGKKTMVGGIIYTVPGAVNGDWSKINTINVKFDLTSQVNKYNQIKIGWIVNHDDINNNYRFFRIDVPSFTWVI